MWTSNWNLSSFSSSSQFLKVENTPLSSFILATWIPQRLLMGESCTHHSTSYSCLQILEAPLVGEYLPHLPNLPSLGCEWREWVIQSVYKYLWSTHQVLGPGDAVRKRQSCSWGDSSGKGVAFTKLGSSFNPTLIPTPGGTYLSSARGFYPNINSSPITSVTFTIYTHIWGCLWTSPISTVRHLSTFLASSLYTYFSRYILVTPDLHSSQFSPSLHD